MKKYNREELKKKILEYIKEHPVFLYNSFANHIKDNYLLSVKNSQLTEILDELGYVKKHFELFDAEGNSSSHPCYYNPNTYKSSLKPLLTRSINHQELVNKKVDM